MPGVIVLSDIEATIDGAALAAKLDALAPEAVCIDLGDSEHGRATLALGAIDAVRARFPQASFSLSARPLVRRLIGAHLTCSGVRLDARTPDLIVDLRPAIRRSTRWIEGAPPRLEVCSVPYPVRRQHAAQHWIDAARAAGFDPGSGAPRLAVPPDARERARTLWSRIAPKQPAVVLASRARGYPKHELAEAGLEVGRRISGRVFSVGSAIDGVSRLPSSDVMVCVAALALASVVIADAGGWCDVAAAAGAPTVGILGRASPARRGPVCDLSIALSARCRSPEQHRPSRARELRCLECLRVTSVVDAAEEVAARRWPWDWAARLGLGGRGS